MKVQHFSLSHSNLNNIFGRKLGNPHFAISHALESQGPVEERLLIVPPPCRRNCFCNHYRLSMSRSGRRTTCRRFHEPAARMALAVLDSLDRSGSRDRFLDLLHGRNSNLSSPGTKDRAIAQRDWKTRSQTSLSSQDDQDPANTSESHPPSQAPHTLSHCNSHLQLHLIHLR